MIQRAPDKPAAIYLRRSTDKQEQSLNDQRSVIVRWAQQRGFSIVADDYVDDAISGTSATGRPAFLRMIEDASRTDCPFRHILVYDTKRFSRGGPDEAGHYRHILRQHGVTVHCVAEGFTGGRGDNLLHAVYDHMAREDSVSLSRVTIRGQVSAAGKGRWNGGMPPYGYDLDYTSKAGNVLYRVRYLESGHKQMIGPDGHVLRTLAHGERISKEKSDDVRLVASTAERVALVREIFDMYRRGLGFKAIAAALNERGIPSPKNGKWSTRTFAGWSSSTIRSILVNPIYLGAIAYNRRAGGRVHRISNGEAVERDPVLAAGRNGKKIFTPNPPSDHVFAEVRHDTIIDRETWEAVQRTRAANAEARCGEAFRGGRAKTSKHLLTGLMRCHCGHTYGGATVPKGKRRIDGTRVVTRYYECQGYRTKGPVKCTKVLIPANDLESGVVGHIEQRVVDFLQSGGEQVLRAVLASAARRWLEGHVPDPSTIEERLGVIGADIKRLLANLSPITKKHIEEEIATLDREREALVGQLEQLRVWKAAAPDVGRAVDEIVAQMANFQEVFAEGTPEEKKELIRLFVEEIRLDAEKRVAVCRIKKFPAPKDLDAGKLSFGLVAGAGFEPATFGL